jgi:hypothetical protein
MANATNSPAPQSNANASFDPASWAYQNVDSTIPLSQWQSWNQYYVPGSTGNSRYHSYRTDANGNTISQLVENPANCPDGTTAWGQSQCVDVNSPQVQNLWNAPVDPSTGKPYAPGTGPNANGGQTAAPTPPPMWDTSGKYNPTGSGTADTSIAPGGSLQDQMQQMLASKSGLFGMTNGRTPNAGYAGSMAVDMYGNPLPQAPNVNAQALSGGGLLWSNGDLGLTPPAAAPQPGGGGGGNLQSLAQALTMALMPGSSVNSFTKNPSQSGSGFSNINSGGFGGANPFGGASSYQYQYNNPSNPFGPANQAYNNNPTQKTLAGAITPYMGGQNQGGGNVSILPMPNRNNQANYAAS